MSQDEKDPYAMPGGDPFKKKKDLNPSSKDEIFTNGKGGGGGKPKPAHVQNNADDDDLIPNTPPPPPPKEPPVRLYNPKWSVDSAHFEDRVSLSVEADLPESLKDITRVIVTLYALFPNGKKEQVKSRDLYINIEDGKVQGEFDLYRLAKRDGKEVESCQYVFTAKHRDSKELESIHLLVKEKPAGNEELVLEVPSSEELKTGGYSFELKSNDGSIDSKIETKNSEEKSGNLILKFLKLYSHLTYTLTLLNSQGEIVDTIFSDTLFGKWSEAVK